MNLITWNVILVYIANRVFIVQILAYIKIPEGQHFLIPLLTDLIKIIKININYLKVKADEKQNRNQY